MGTGALLSLQAVEEILSSRDRGLDAPVEQGNMLVVCPKS